ncbi:MAG: hypothetical protein HY900_07395, partial [Deltaproteobacteria bacterium]|nr:hypothetical protein [Deltaproteobacteria bacterium]
MASLRFGNEKGWFRRGTAIVTVVSFLAVPLTAAADRGGSRHRGGWESDERERSERFDDRERRVVRERSDWRRHDDDRRVVVDSRRVVVDSRHFGPPPANWR